MNVIETTSLGKRYRRNWALADCSIAIPSGQVVALVGPNGAGKTTLLHLLAGLFPPTTGLACLLGGFRPGSNAIRDAVALVGQEAPVYRGMSVRDTLRAARGLNGLWDQQYAEARLDSLGISLRSRAGKLSGGQRAQLALTLALARHPSLLLLDEPLAALDPLARREVLGTLMTAVLEEGVSVVFSSHVLADLENVSTYLIAVGRGRVLLADQLEKLLESHKLLTGPTSEVGVLADQVAVVDATRAGRQAHVLAQCQNVPAGWDAREVTMEELVLGYLSASGDRPGPGPSASSRAQAAEVGP
jgi:ABC-2 type transport system ATP-binding protein